MRQLASLNLTLSFSLLLLPSIPPSLSLTLTSIFRSVSQHFSLSFKISLSIFLHQIITRHVRYTSVLLIQTFFIPLPLPPTPISPSLCLPLSVSHSFPPIFYPSLFPSSISHSLVNIFVSLYLFVNIPNNIPDNIISFEYYSTETHWVKKLPWADD